MEQPADAEDSATGRERGNAKRMRTDFDQEECSISSGHSESTEQTASTSSDSGLATSSAHLEDKGSDSLENRRQSTESIDMDLNRDTMERERLVSTTHDTSSDRNDLSCDSGELSIRNSSSDSTIIHSTDMESDEDAQVNDVLKKDKPKHTWFMVPEFINRQLGYGARKSNPSLFQQRCYGSLMNVQKLELMHKLEEHEGCVNSLNFSPNGNFLASGSDDLKVAIWDWRIGKCLIKADTRHKRNIFQTKFLDLKGPDLHMATSGRDGQVCYLQICNEGVRDGRKLGQHNGPCHKLSVLNDQPHVILSAGEDGIVLNHDLRRNKPERIVHVKDAGREVSLYSIHSHPLKSHEFCVAGRAATVKVYDQRKSSRPLAKFFPFKSTDEKYPRELHITCAVYNYDGSEILASYNDDDVYLFDTDSEFGQFAHRYSGHRNGATIKGVNFFGPKSEFVMSGSDCAHVFFWEKKTEAITQFLLADDNGVVNCLEPHPELPFLATGGLDWDVKFWVPSCEEEPSLAELADTIKENKRNGWTGYESSSESQVLWMLWRRLRASRAHAQETGEEGTNMFLTIDTSEDSSSDSWRSHDDDDDDEDGADESPYHNTSGCNPS